MNEVWLICPLMLLSAGLTAVSQLLLKASANKAHRSRLGEYLNLRVLAAYAIFGVVLLLNVCIYTRLDMRYGVVIHALGSLLVMLLSVVILREKLTPRRMLGNGLILLGLIVFLLF